MPRHYFAGLVAVLTFTLASRSDAQVATAGVAAVDTIHHQRHMSHDCKPSGAVNDTTAHSGTHHAGAHHGRGPAHDSAKHATRPDDAATRVPANGGRTPAHHPCGMSPAAGPGRGVPGGQTPKPGTQ